MRHGRSTGLEDPRHLAGLGEGGEIAGVAVEHDRVEDVSLVDPSEFGVDTAKLGAAAVAVSNASSTVSPARCMSEDLLQVLPVLLAA